MNDRKLLRYISRRVVSNMGRFPASFWNDLRLRGLFPVDFEIVVAGKQFSVELNMTPAADYRRFPVSSVKFEGIGTDANKGAVVVPATSDYVRLEVSVDDGGEHNECAHLDIPVDRDEAFSILSLLSKEDSWLVSDLQFEDDNG